MSWIVLNKAASTGICALRNILSTLLSWLVLQICEDLMSTHLGTGFGGPPRPQRWQHRTTTACGTVQDGVGQNGSLQYPGHGLPSSRSVLVSSDSSVKLEHPCRMKLLLFIRNQVPDRDSSAAVEWSSSSAGT